MKKIYTFSIFLMVFFSSFGQHSPEGFHIDKPIDMAAILKAKQPSVAMGFSSISEARSIINDIMGVVGQQQNFKVLSTTQIENAAAVIYQGERYILYNPSFINKLDDIANDKWASVSVVAHEIGHHLLGHMLDGRGSQLPKELGADEFSGAVLHRLGATLHQSQLAMKLISSPYASATHPGQKDRLTAIEKGWYSSTTQQPSNTPDVAIQYPDNKNGNSTPNPDRYPNPGSNYPTNRNPQGNRTARQGYPEYPETTRRRGMEYPGSGRQRSGRADQGTYGNRGSVYNAETITYEMKFKRGNGTSYYITSKNNVVKSSGNRLYVVAKIANSNRPNYPYVIYDDQVQLYVDIRGNVYDEAGRSVGYITHRS